MSPYRSASTTPRLESKNLMGVLGIIKSLAKVVEKHVSVGGRSKDKDVETEESTIELFRRMVPLEFKGAPDPVEAESWIM